MQRFVFPKPAEFVGATFETELAAAGIAGTAMVSVEDGVDVVEVVVADEVAEAAVAAVLASHSADVPTSAITVDEKIAELVDAISVLTDVVFTLL